MQDLIDKIIYSIHVKFGYKALIQPSADDAQTLCVRVFGVPKKCISEVENLIFDIQDRLVESSDFMLLPMVKSLEVTKEYYPEYLPITTSRLNVGAYGVLLKNIHDANDWQVGNTLHCESSGNHDAKLDKLELNLNDYATPWIKEDVDGTFVSQADFALAA
jgi:hypothetical protein